jgi:hypothetical protein
VIRRVIVECPSSGTPQSLFNRPSALLLQARAERATINLAYARAAMRHSLLAGEAPMISRLLYTQLGVIDESIAGEQAMSIDAGRAWRAAAHAIVVYVDHSVPPRAVEDIIAARAAGIVVEARSLEGADAEAILEKYIAIWDLPLPERPALAQRRRVILESPFAAPTQDVIDSNIAYARSALRASLLRGEAPMASHLLYTQAGVLDDTIPAERTLGIDAGLAWREAAEASVVYADRGISRGMVYGIKAAEKSGLPVEPRSLHGADAQAIVTQLMSEAA